MYKSKLILLKAQSCLFYDVFSSSFSGEFNAQTADLADFTIADDFLDRHFDLDLDDDMTSFYNQKSILERLGIQVHRKLKDTKKNNHGYKLI